MRGQKLQKKELYHSFKHYIVANFVDSCLFAIFTNLFHYTYHSKPSDRVRREKIELYILKNK